MHAMGDDFQVDIGVDADALDRAVVARLRDRDIDVPPFPKAVLQLQQLSGTGASLSAFVDVVARDPALAVRVLRVANSASFGRLKPAVTLHEAVGAVGTNMVVRIALADGLAAAVCTDGPLVALKDRYWRHAISGALLAAALAPGRALKADLVFVCALLHDFGKLLAVKLVEEILVSGDVPGTDIVEEDFWVDVVERYHTELGIVAAVKWALPDTIAECISTHHAPLTSSENHNLLSLINSVDSVVGLLDEHTVLAASDLKVTGLSDRECQVVCQALRNLPSLIVSFTLERLVMAPPVSARPAMSTSTPMAASLSSTPSETALSGVARDARLWAETVGSTKQRRFEVRELSGRRVLLVGAEGLPLNQVFRVKVSFSQPREVWLRVTASQANGAQVEVSCVPFALTGEDATDWWNRVRDHQAKTVGASAVA
jgi:putative nucleotidyltransferase with HDIG domain